MWKNIADSSVLNIRKIFPLQQKAVAQFVEEVSRYPEVKRIIIFGSSIESRCNPWSDIDIYVELESNIILDNSVFSKPLDILTNFDVSEADDIYSEIMKGVIVYEKHSARYGEAQS